MLVDCQRDCWADQPALPNEFRHFCFLTTIDNQNCRVTRILGDDKGAAEQRVGTAQNIKLVNALLFLLGADPVLVAKVHRLFVDAPRPSEKDTYCCREWVNTVCIGVKDQPGASSCSSIKFLHHNEEQYCANASGALLGTSMAPMNHNLGHRISI